MDGYRLSRSTRESVRLDAQHEIYTTTIEFLLQPRILDFLPERAEARVVDFVSS